MKVDEDLLAPLRDEFGLARRELRLIRPYDGKVWDDKAVVIFRKLRSHLPSDLFAPAWILYAKELNQPDFRGTDDMDFVVFLSFLKWVPVLKPGVTLEAIQHQAGGMSCAQYGLMGIRLTPRPDIRARFLDIAIDRYEQHMTVGDPMHGDPKQAASLEADLKPLGLSCRWTGHHVNEAIYPIDASDETLRIIAENPPRLSDLIVDFDPEAEKTNLAVLILSRNCD